MNELKKSSATDTALPFIFRLERNVLFQILLFLPAIKLGNLCQVSKTMRETCIEIVNPILTILSEKHKWINTLISNANCKFFWQPLHVIHLLTSPHVVVIGGNLERNRVNLIDIKNKLKSLDIADTSVGREVFFESLWYRGYVYIFCGIHHVSYGKVERYNCVSNTWTTCPSLPGQLAGVVGCALKGNLYITGGYDWHLSQLSNRVFVTDDKLLSSTDLSSDKCWKLLDARLNFRRSSHACAAYRGKIWVAGGTVQGQTCEGSHSVEIFDPNLETNQWYNGPDLLIRRFRLRLLVIKDELYAVGGDRDERGKKVIQTIEKLVFDNKSSSNIYNKHTNSARWVHVATFKEDRRGFLSSVVGNKIYIIGGRCGDIPLHSWETFDVRTKNWLSHNDSAIYSNAAEKSTVRSNNYSDDITTDDEDDMGTESNIMMHFYEHSLAINDTSLPVMNADSNSRPLCRVKGIVGGRAVTMPGCNMNW